MGKVRNRLSRLPNWVRILAGIVVLVALIGGISWLRYGVKPSSKTEDTFYTGTEAANWPKGVNLVLPSALAQEHFTAEQVRAALDDLEDLLILSRVDWAEGKGDPAAFVRAHSPAIRQDLAAAIDGADRLALVSALAEGHKLIEEVRYIYAEPPTADEVKDEDGVTVLEITVKTRFAYYFDRKGQRYYDPLVILNSTMVWHLAAEGEVDPSTAGFWIADLKWDIENADCEAALDGRIAPAHMGGKEAVLDADGNLSGCK